MASLCLTFVDMIQTEVFNYSGLLNVVLQLMLNQILRLVLN